MWMAKKGKKKGAASHEAPPPPSSIQSFAADVELPADASTEETSSSPTLPEDDILTVDELPGVPGSKGGEENEMHPSISSTIASATPIAIPDSPSSSYRSSSFTAPLPISSRGSGSSVPKRLERSSVGNFRVSPVVSKGKDELDINEMSFESYAPQTPLLGLRAEPRPVKHPSTLANITSIVSGISSFVSQGFAGSSSNGARDDLVLDEDVEEKLPPEEQILASKFVWVDWDMSLYTRQKRNNAAAASIQKSLCLLLGYERGFQIWHATDVDNIREVFSVREGIGRVDSIEAKPNILQEIPSLSSPLYDNKVDAEISSARPLVVLGSSIPLESSSDGNLGAAIIYSLKQLKAIRTFTYGSNLVCSIRCSERILVVGTSDAKLHIYSLFNLHLLSVLTDALPNPISQSTVFAVGTRYLVYASSTLPPIIVSKRRNSNFMSDQEDEVDFELESRGQNSATAVASAVGAAVAVGAGKVAKEMLGGVKVLGGIGYQALSSYFQGSNQSEIKEEAKEAKDTKPVTNERRSSVTKETPKPQRPRKSEADGVIIVRDIHPSLLNSTTQVDLPILAHWKPHTHSISIISLNPIGTLFVTASIVANNFYVWAIPPGPAPRSTGPLDPNTTPNPTVPTAALKTARCLYKLERGYTQAKVEDVAFSRDGKWIGVSTARGTTHLYEIDSNPLGVSVRPTAAALELGNLNGLLEGRPGNCAVLDLSSVPKDSPLAGLVGPHTVVPLYPTARIKQHLPLDPKPANANTGSTEEGEDSNVTPRAKLIVAFLSEKFTGTASSNQSSSASPVGLSKSSSSAPLMQVGASSLSPAAGTGGPLSWGSRAPPGISPGHLAPSPTHPSGSPPSSQSAMSATMRRLKILTLHPSGTLMLTYVDVMYPLPPVPVSSTLSPDIPLPMSPNPTSALLTGTSPGKRHPINQALNHQWGPGNLMVNPTSSTGSTTSVKPGGSVASGGASLLSATMQQLGSTGSSIAAGVSGGAGTASGVRVTVQEILEWTVSRERHWKEMPHGIKLRPTPQRDSK
ncbi:hypothetical protein HDU97_002032 [Phlyctochytrium planicorne]|nr:hypothetical protein HDU97_002032 [Phlyctochytrium planicorne]